MALANSIDIVAEQVNAILDHREKEHGIPVMGCELCKRWKGLYLWALEPFCSVEYKPKRKKV